VRGVGVNAIGFDDALDRLRGGEDEFWLAQDALDHRFDRDAAGIEEAIERAARSYHEEGDFDTLDEARAVCRAVVGHYAGIFALGVNEYDPEPASAGTPERTVHTGSCFRVVAIDEDEHGNRCSIRCTVLMALDGLRFERVEDAVDYAESEVREAGRQP